MEVEFHVVRELIKSVLTPMAITWVLLLVVLVFYFAGKKRWSKWVAGVAIVWFMVISTPFVPEYFLSKLENKFLPVTLNSARADLVLQ